MKDVLDIYLQQKGLTKEVLLKNGDITEYEVAKISRREPRNYSEKMLNELAEKLSVTPCELLEELKRIHASDELFEVVDAAELSRKVKAQEEEFIVKGDFRQLMKEIQQSQVSELAELGFELGSGGVGTLIAQGVLRVFNFFEDDPKLENLKQDIAQLYWIDFINEDEAKLRLKQLDY